MGTGSGLDAQLMFGQESLWGTGVTPDHALEFDSETLTFDPGWLEPTGLRPGKIYKRNSRVRQSRKSVSGDITVEHATKGLGLWWKNALGSSITVPTQIGSTTAWKQIHTPGGLFGLGMTFQIGRPEPGTGTVRPFTFAGCKCLGWEFDIKDNAIPTLKLTLDGRNEDTTTTLATPAYLSNSSVFDFSQASLKLGGTPTTTSGETTIAGGVAATTIITDWTLTGSTPAATDRFGLGNAGLKSQQLQNDNPTITGKLAAEFGKVEFYDVYKANTTQAMQLDFTGSLIGVSASNFLLSFILPAVKIKTAPANVSGADIVQMSTTIEVYDNEIDPVIQVKIVSDETTL